MPSADSDYKGTVPHTKKSLTHENSIYVLLSKGGPTFNYTEIIDKGGATITELSGIV